MSDNRNQYPDKNNQQPENNPPPKTGGLLSNYKTQQPSSAAPNGDANPASLPPAASNRNNSSLLRGNYQQPPAQPSKLSQYAQQQPPAQPSKLSQYAQQQPPAQPSKLSQYAQQPQGNQRPAASQPSYGAGGQQWSAPAQGAQYAQRPPQQQASNRQMPPGMQPPRQHQGLLSNTMDMMRQWSGKMASVAGYAPQPPAPYMDLYRPASPSGLESSIPETQQTAPWKRSRVLRINQQKRQRRYKMRSGPARGLTITLATLVVLIVLASVGTTAYGYTYYQDQEPRMQAYANQHINQNTRIYDRNGVLLYESYNNQKTVYDGRRIVIKFEDVPKVMQDAMIAIEDRSFWTNSGVNPLSIVRAGATSNGGGSTLTQQVIKNLTHDIDHTPQRKIAEAAMALSLAQQYSKEKVLEMYFNVAPFGAQTFGVEVAAEDYFGVKATCQPNQKCTPGIATLDYNAQTKKHDPILGLARASFLATQPNGPSLTDPTLGAVNKQKALDRQELVLNAMIEQGMSVDGQLITPEMAKQAEALMAKQTFHGYSHSKRAPHFVDWVINQVVDALSTQMSREDALYAFQTGGYNIRTTVDVNLDEYTQRAITRHIDQEEYQAFTDPHDAILSRDYNVNDAAVVVMDAKTGEVLTMVGSADYNNPDIKVGGNFNAASPPPGSIVGTSPGSTMKPIIYSTAFQMGWYPGMVVPDQQTNFPKPGATAGTPVPTVRVTDAPGLYIPPDYGNAYHREHVDGTIRVGTANSFNVTALRAMQYAGTSNVFATAQRMGITTLANNGMAWGLGTQGVPLLQMAGAYQTLANSGSHIAPQGVLDIWDNTGHSLYHYNTTKPQAAQILSPQVSYLMTSVLRDEPSRDFEFHGDHDLSFADKDANCAHDAECSLQVAAKTGTTDSFKDNLTIGYSPDAVVAVWSGNANGEPMSQAIVGITGAAPIWHSVMERTVGWCNETNLQMDYLGKPDQIACGPAPKLRFSANPQRMFTQPAGVSKIPTSFLNGLEGGTNFDYMLTSQAPLQSGLVPNSTSFGPGAHISTATQPVTKN